MKEIGHFADVESSSAPLSAAQAALLVHVNKLLERIESNEVLLDRILAEREGGAEHEAIGAIIMEELGLPEIARVAAKTASLKICAKYIDVSVRKTIRREIWSKSLDSGRTRETTSAGGKARAEKRGGVNGDLWLAADDDLLRRLTQEHVRETGARKGAPDYRKITELYNQEASVKRTLQSLQARGRMLILKAADI